MFQTNCTSLFSLFPHKSTMPIELAMPLYLSNDDFCYTRSPESLQPLRPCLKPCLRFKPSAPPMQTEPDLLHEKNGKPKRRVSFADHKGLALTKVKFFSHFDTIDIPLNITDLFSSSLKLPYEEDRLVMGFTQPSSDYLLFRQRLETELVCLEHCMLKEKALSGTVKVKNLSFEKSVKVRVTFDTWKSYMDLECQYLKDNYTGSNYDTFAFEVSLPAELRPHKHIEFAICYEVNGQTYWDGNQGRNYRIIWSALKMDGQGSFSSNQQRHSFDLGIQFDFYGSPRCSHGMFPEWPSYAGYEDIRPYY
ncbi:protein phosphatase 1 regulatory subunit 3B-like isoform X1 [Salvelinus namaycush]|uniref:Protein phosphatase 1 regulatory subunit n=2 Tax=Salvelinus namaycush TaxID=8040 RepID=A0A8U0TSE5_SALNM|nr:protein phosphatase 1 regulatory subunit 3B-like isoform X1 [Salvelinus namaycush]